MRRADRVHFGAVVGGVQLETIDENVAVLNSAGFPFDPPQEIEDYIIILTYVRNEPLASYNPGIAQAYMGRSNSDVFLGTARGCARIEDYTGVLAFENGLQFYKVTYRFAFREEGWDIELYDCGFQRRAGGAGSGSGSGSGSGGARACGEVRNFLDRAGLPRAEPTALDGDGNELPCYAPQVFLTYRPKARVPFAPLAIVVP